MTPGPLAGYFRVKALVEAFVETVQVRLSQLVADGLIDDALGALAVHNPNGGFARYVVVLANNSAARRIDFPNDTNDALVRRIFANDVEDGFLGALSVIERAALSDVGGLIEPRLGLGGRRKLSSDAGGRKGFGGD